MMFPKWGTKQPGRKVVKTGVRITSLSAWITKRHVCWDWESESKDKQWDGKMAQWVMCLPHKGEDLSADSQNLHHVSMVHIYNPSTPRWEVETRESSEAHRTFKMVYAIVNSKNSLKVRGHLRLSSDLHGHTVECTYLLLHPNPYT